MCNFIFSAVPGDSTMMVKFRSSIYMALALDQDLIARNVCVLYLIEYPIVMTFLSETSLAVTLLTIDSKHVFRY